MIALVAVLVAVAAPVAAASYVPDPTWIAGLYDGADGDELVALVWDQSPASLPRHVDGPRLDSGPLARLAAPRPRFVLPSPSFESRAPPLLATVAHR